MKKSIGYKFALIGILSIISIIYFLPSLPFYQYMPNFWKETLPDHGIVLGLDLQGGTHLVFEVQGSKAVETMKERMVLNLQKVFERKKIDTEISLKNGEFLIPSTAKEAKKIIDENYPNVLTLSTITEDSVLYLLSREEIKRIKEGAIDQALETIRNRIDQFGVAEPDIHKQSHNEIVVQLPGIKDPKRAIELIGKTAVLEFKLLDEESPLVAQFPSMIDIGGEDKFLDEFKDKIPENDEILFERLKDNETGRIIGKKPFLIKKNTLLTGDLLTEAKVSINPGYNEPYVSLSFNSVGAKLFEQITAENIKKRLAIILDDNIYSAPVIQDRISGGNAQITGRFSMEEAKDLSIVLRAGALPAPLKMLQNVTVGPSLGRDSIEAGVYAGIIASVLVIAFMIIYYKLSGLIADFALILNILLLLGVLSMFNATLTLPGIAGVILAVGLAVDTNVLMFERMREELKAGKTPRAAVDSGYDKAFLTIVDSHVTTLITAAVLYQFGTGPIKGFAVTLFVGVAINLFTALVGTKTVFDYIHLKRDVKTLSI